MTAFELYFYNTRKVYKFVKFIFFFKSKLSSGRSLYFFERSVLIARVWEGVSYTTNTKTFELSTPGFENGL